jgi:hypothetical protein
MTAGTAAAVLATACISLAADWPQFLGPERNSTSPETGILRSWPASGPEILWTVPVGRGYGGPVVKDGEVYLLDRDDAVGDELRAFSLSDGKQLWSFGYKAPGSVMFPGSRSVPTVDGDRVYSCGQNGELYYVNRATRKPVWSKNVWKDFGGGELPIGGSRRTRWSTATCSSWPPRRRGRVSWPTTSSPGPSGGRPRLSGTSATSARPS